MKLVIAQLRQTVAQEQENRIVVFDSGGYSAANMKSYNDANITWMSRVPETSTAAKDVLEQEPEQWTPLTDGLGVCVGHLLDLPQGKQRWVLVRSFAQQLAA